VPAEEYNDAVILPGLINTHTHLELTGFDRVETPDFPGWIRRLRDLKASRSPAEYLVAARRGVAECFSAGVTTIADTGDSGVVVRALAEMGGVGVAYHEVFGPDPAQCDASLAGLETRIGELRQWAVGRVRLGVSPHAPYTVSGALLDVVVQWAIREQLPLAVHISESRDEVELVTRGTGAFAEAWRARGIPVPGRSGTSPIEWLALYGALTKRTLCIHAVQAGTPEIAQLARTGAAVAHCPLSNDAHGHGAAPLGKFLAAGIPVGLGTDSVVSVGELDLFAEARAAQALAGLSADEALALCTLGGARALGIDLETGSLQVGKWGDCVVIRVSDRPGQSPAAQVLACSPADVMLTCVAGREVFRAQ
jgi:5-methylthioadenosine/S-adenosylhomocysteine deaminase